MVGFSQFRQSITGVTFSNLTDSPNGFSFWFNLQPNGNAGMAGFEVRIFGAESTDELDYAFNPDPSIGTFANYTLPNDPGVRALLLYGYQPGQWYHFSRDLKADWTSLNLNATRNFSLIQFQGFASQTGTQVRSETFWLDDVRVYVGTQAPPTETHWTSFNFTDTNGNIVNNIVKWKVLNSTGQQVPYTLGQSTLPTGPYTLEAYYLAYDQDTLILREQIPLDASLTIRLAMIPNNTIPGNYIVLNNPVTSTVASQPDSSRLQIVIQGSAGTGYAMLVGVTTQPVLVQGNGIDLAQGTDWTYNSALSLARILFTTPSGQEDITIFFKTPLRLPSISFVDISGTSLNSQISFKILDSQGNIIPYSLGKILPTEIFFLEAYYQSYRIYRNTLNTDQTTPIALEMLPLGTATNSYLALNNTATKISISETSNSRIAFQIQGSGPYLIVLNVPTRPIRVEQNGALTASWIYNATAKTVAIETDTQGSFQVVLQEPPPYTYLYTGGAIATVIAAGLLVVVMWRRRLPKQIVAKPVGQKQAQLLESRGL